MGDIEKIILAIFGGVLALAIVSVIVGRNSKAPQAINAFTGGIAKLISAAVSPASTSATNGNLGANVNSTPSGGSGGSGFFDSLGSNVLDQVFNPNFVSDQVLSLFH